MGQDTNGAIYHFKKIHNNILGPTSIRNSSKFVVLLTIILCIILIWTLVSPWFVYTVTHDNIYDSYTGNWDDVGTVGSQDAFTYEYYLGYGHVKQGNFYYESTAKTKYLQHSENLNYPWFSNTNNVDFWIDYGEYEELKHRDYVSSVTLALGLVSLTSYILAIITGFIFYRMTTELEPNSLNFRNKENFQLKIKSFAKKMTLLKKKKIIISSLEPYLNQLEKIYASKDAEEVVIKNPLTRLYLMNLFIIIGILCSLVATWYYSQNWYEAGIDDGLNGNIEADSSWIMTSAADYNFYGNWHLSPMITLLHFSSLMGLILTFSHTIFLKRSCYNMITEIIDGSAKTNDFKIPSELLNDIEETLPIVEEDPLAPVELPDPGEGLLLDEAVESEEESVDDEN
jgi:DUF2075 family protein